MTRAILYNGHLRGPATLTPVAERLAVELLQAVLKTKVSPDRRSNPDLSHAWRTLYYYATAAVTGEVKTILKEIMTLRYMIKMPSLV